MKDNKTKGDTNNKGEESLNKKPEPRVNVSQMCDNLGMSSFNRTFLSKFYGDKKMSLTSWKRELKGKI